MYKKNLRSLQELKTKHSNLLYAIQRCIDAPEHCSHIDMIPQLIKSHLKVEERITQDISGIFPVDHLNEHLALSEQVDSLAKNINHYDASDFASILKTLYMSHHYGYDLAHYDSMTKKIINTAT